MKSKLTLTIEGGITHRAKILARRRGKSLSQLVEELSEREADGKSPASDQETFSNRWAEKMKLAENKDPRFSKLREKYGFQGGE